LYVVVHRKLKPQYSFWIEFSKGKTLVGSPKRLKNLITFDAKKGHGELCGLNNRAMKYTLAGFYK